MWLGIYGPLDEQQLGFYSSDGDLHIYGMDGRLKWNRQEHRWWQIAVEDDVVRLSVSPHGKAWCHYAEVPAPAWLDAAFFEIGVGSFLVESDHEDLGTFEIDNLNLPPGRCDDDT